MLAALLALVMWGEPPTDVAPASPEAAGAALLDAALRADARRQPELRDRLLRGWATVGARPDPPAALAAPAQEALKWSAGVGPLRVFATRHGDRVRVGLDDPAPLGVRIEAIGRSADRAVTLARADVESPGRIEHVVEPILGADARVEVRAWCDAVEPPLLLRRVVLGGADVAPDAPDPASLRGAPPSLRPPPRAVVAAPEAQWPWWWFAVGAVALGLAGAAVVEETR